MSIQYPIDLHIHSTISDGLRTPAELYAQARDEGLTAFALCDHDTVAGVPIMQEVIRQEVERCPDSPPLRYLPSIELSSFSSFTSTPKPSKWACPPSPVLNSMEGR